MSAASKPSLVVAFGEEELEQFEISDERSAADVESMIRQRGFRPSVA